MMYSTLHRFYNKSLQITSLQSIQSLLCLWMLLYKTKFSVHFKTCVFQVQICTQKLRSKEWQCNEQDGERWLLQTPWLSYALGKACRLPRLLSNLSKHVYKYLQVFITILTSTISVQFWLCGQRFSEVSASQWHERFFIPVLYPEIQQPIDSLNLNQDPFFILMMLQVWWKNPLATSTVFMLHSRSQEATTSWSSCKSPWKLQRCFLWLPWRQIPLHVITPPAFPLRRNCLWSLFVLTGRCFKPHTLCPLAQ